MIKLNKTIIVKLIASKENEKKKPFNYHNFAHVKVTIILKSRLCKGWNDSHETKNSTV